MGLKTYRIGLGITKLPFESDLLEINSSPNQDSKEEYTYIYQVKSTSEQELGDIIVEKYLSSDGKIDHFLITDNTKFRFYKVEKELDGYKLMDKTLYVCLYEFKETATTFQNQESRNLHKRLNSLDELIDFFNPEFTTCKNIEESMEQYDAEMLARAEGILPKKEKDDK